MMSLRDTLMEMLHKLLDDMLTLHQQGAGYYSCKPFIRRFNKLLNQARTLFPDEHGLIETFDEAEEVDPKDPSEKMKIVQGLRVEIGQLLALLDSTRDETPAQEEKGGGEGE